MKYLTLKTLDLQPGDILIPRPNTADQDGDTVEDVRYPPHNQLHNAAVVYYIRKSGERKQFLAGIETSHKIKRADPAPD